MMTHDDNAAPCHQNGLTSLAICKGQIRKTAKVGDIVIGLMSQKLAAMCNHSHGSLIWCGIVEQVLTMQEYANKFPQRADSIYTSDLTLKPNSYHLESEIQADLRGRNVLMFQDVVRWCDSDVSGFPLLTKCLGQGHTKDELTPQLLKQIAAVRQYSGGEQCFGSTDPERTTRVQRVLTIEALIDELESQCDSYTKAGQQRDKSNKKQFSLEWQFAAGRSIRALTTEAGNPTWAYKHNFKDGKGVYMRDVADSTKTPQQKALYAKACELLPLIDADYAGEYKDYVVNFSCMSEPELHYVKQHTDDDDIKFQYALVLGDCTGGELKVWDSHGNEQVIDYKNKILKLDGRLPHEVLPFTGRRYCIIWYKVFDRRMTQSVFT